MNKRKDPLWQVVKILPSDYSEYGGEIERWKNDELYPDCSSGCRWWRPLWNEHSRGPDGDWGICSNSDSARSGLLTWEHQAGYDCWECESESCGD